MTFGSTQQQTASLGCWAAISCRAGVPLMYAFTRYVEVMIGKSSGEEPDLLTRTREELLGNCHVGHILSHIGDYIGIAQRSTPRTVSSSSGPRRIKQPRLTQSMRYPIVVPRGNSD